MDGIVYFVADNEVKLPRGGSLKCGKISVLGSLFVLLGSDITGAQISGIVKTFAAFVEQKVVTIYG